MVVILDEKIKDSLCSGMMGTIEMVRIKEKEKQPMEVLVMGVIMVVMVNGTMMAMTEEKKKGLSNGPRGKRDRNGEGETSVGGGMGGSEGGDNDSGEGRWRRPLLSSL